MEYTVKLDKHNRYDPTASWWIRCTFPKLNYSQIHLYNLILVQGVLLFTQKYLAEIFTVNVSTIKRWLREMEQNGLIKKVIISNGSKKKCILVALYTQHGKRTRNEIKQLVNEGVKAARKWLKSGKSREVLDFENIPLDENWVPSE